MIFHAEAVNITLNQTLREERFSVPVSNFSTLVRSNVSFLAMDSFDVVRAGP
jgi:hypothetical protein